MNFESVRSIIDTYIKKNGVEAITGDILNNVLNTMLDDVDTAISSIEPSPGGGGGGTADLSNYYTKGEADARYLALSGGTIASSSTDTPLTIKNNNTSGAWIGFDNSYGNLGYIGYTYEKKLHCYDENGVARIVLHTNNIGSYAMRWMGGANTGADVNSFSFAAGAFGVASALNSPTSTGYGAVLNLPYRVGHRNAPDYMGQIYIPNGDDADRSIFYRTSLAETWQPWRRIVSEDDNGNVTLYGTHLFANKYIFMNDGGEGIYLSTDAISWHNASNAWVRDIVVFASSGNVGIGTTSPSYKLDIVNGSNAGYDIFSKNSINNASFGVGQYGLFVDIPNINNNIIELYGAGAKVFSVKGNGNVGIGISSPTCELDVVGGIKATKPIFGYMYGTNNNAAAFIFDKPGSNYTGIGSDGVSDTIRFGACNVQGGWVDYNQKWKFYGDVIVTGDFSFGSDMRFKDKIEDMGISIADIANAPLFTYKWKDRDDDVIYLGSSAQYWEKIAPWLVSGDDFKSLNYATLGVAMGISLAKKTINHEERIKILEAEIKRLKREQYGN